MPFLAPAVEPDVLASADELTAYRGGEAVPEDQALLALQAATAAVRSYCGWRLDAARETFTIDGSNSVDVLLPSLHVRAVRAATLDGTELVEDTDFTWSRSGIVRAATSWGSALRSVVLDVEHGYTPLPADIKGVVLAAAARAVTTPNGETRENTGQWAASYAGAGVQLLDSERLLLNPYRLPD